MEDKRFVMRMSQRELTELRALTEIWKPSSHWHRTPTSDFVRHLIREFKAAHPLPPPKP